MRRDSAETGSVHDAMSAAIKESGAAAVAAAEAEGEEPIGGALPVFASGKAIGSDQLAKNILHVSISVPVRSA